MPNPLFDSVVAKTKRELPHISIATVSGFGEFSTDPQWRHKIVTASNNYERIHIVTNMSLLNQEDILFLLDHVSDIRISIYGLDQSTYKAVHNPPLSITYQAIHESIRFLIQNKSSHQRVILNYIEIDANRHQTEDWISYWERKVDLIEVWKPHNWIDSKCYRDIDSQRLPTCGRPFNGPIQVQVDGTVNVCCFDYNGEMLIGDLCSESFTEIFNGNSMNSIQKLHADGNADQLPLCKICDQRNSYESKAKNAIYNSRFSIAERIHTTSTEYDSLIDNHQR
jgi:sulfatase maturation enzyme AslB (radical SAM superfamily)